MKGLFFISLFICSKVAITQSLTPGVFNTDGGTATIASPTGPVIIYYNIGEPLYDNIQNTNSKIKLTQGFLQPDIIGVGALQINTYTTAMTCVSANDASIILNSVGANSPFIYKWFKNGMQLPDTSSTLLNLGIGHYEYTVSDSKGNKRSGSIQVNSGEGECALIIHNGLSANNDGHNDFFHIEHIEDYNNNVSIYSRWGSLVWEAAGYNNSSVAWKGDDQNGNNLLSGTYFFMIIIDGRKINGWVELMR